jgi:hypothetical protein
MPIDRKWRYSAYGLAIEANRPIPAFTSTDCAGEVDVRIALRGKHNSHTEPVDGTVLYQSTGCADDGTPYYTVARLNRSNGGLRCRYTSESGHGNFDVDIPGECVDITWTEGVFFDDLSAYLTGPVMGCVLRLRGTVCLHAGVISLGTRAILIMGPKGAGKSTLTAAFACDGNAILADDIAALADHGEDIMVQPGYPRLRLWPDAIENLTTSRAEEMAPVLRCMDKRLQVLTQDPEATSWRFGAKSLPVAAVYILNPERTDEAPSINEQLRGAKAMVSLASNTYANYVCDTQLCRHELTALARVAKAVPVYTVRTQSGFDGVRRLRDVIRNHC